MFIGTFWLTRKMLLRPTKTCSAVPLHKPSRNEARQNDYHYGVHTPSKVMRTTMVYVRENRSPCFDENAIFPTLDLVYWVITP
jgi:hypothetical protein